MIGTQALLTHVQLASLLALMNIEWPKVLGGVFKAAAWMVHAAPQVSNIMPLGMHECVLPVCSVSPHVPYSPEICNMMCKYDCVPQVCSVHKVHTKQRLQRLL